MRVNKLSGIVMRVAAILICLVLFSAHLASGMFAKYATGVSADSSARAAKFHVEVKESSALTFDDSGNGTYQFYVYNQDSEVAFQYDIIVRVKAADPSGLFSASEVANACTDLRLNYKNSTYDGTYSEGSNSYTFSVSDRLEPGMDSEVYTLTFKKADLTKVNADAAEAVTTTEIPIELNVSAKGTQAV